MNQAVLLFGGNLGDRKAIISEARERVIADCGRLILQSGFYESEAWGFEAQENFLNQAIEIKTELEANDLLAALQKIENEMGRKRKSNHYESRGIDIDILFFNSEIINQENLIVPHPRLHLRRFTLKCLLDFMADFIHPVLNKSIKELSNSCKDKVKVWSYRS